MPSKQPLILQIVMIKAKDLSFSYNGRKVIRSVDITINEGKITGILGPNGAGKSTLLKLLGGYLKADHGAVFINGDNLNNISHKQKVKIISFVAQNYNFSFPYTCYDFVMMGRFPYLGYLGFENKEDANAVNKALETTDIVHLKDRLINTLSGGEAQRTLIAQALASNSLILFLDEPVNHLDIKYQIEILDLIKKLKTEKNMTIIMVIHDLNLAGIYCDEIILLKNGSALMQGEAHKIITEENVFKVFDIHVKFIKEGKNSYFLPLPA